MNKIFNTFFIVVIFLLINSCSENPFMSNLFSEVDKFEMPDSFSSTDDILNTASDDGFLDALAEDPELAEEVITILETDLNLQDPSTDGAGATGEEQEAALLLADVYLATSEADDTVNNVNNLLVDLVNDPDSVNFDKPEDVVVDIINVDETAPVEEQEAAVTAQLEAFLGAADALEYYGESIDTTGENPEVNSGETAATAMVSGMTAYLIENMVDSNGDDMSDADAIAALTDVIVNGAVMPDVAEPTDANGDPLPDDATTEETLEAMLGSGLTDVVGAGFDLNAMGDMGV